MRSWERESNAIRTSSMVLKWRKAYPTKGGRTMNNGRTSWSFTRRRSSQVLRLRTRPPMYKAGNCDWSLRNLVFLPSAGWVLVSLSLRWFSFTWSSLHELPRVDFRPFLRLFWATFFWQDRPTASFSLTDLPRLSSFFVSSLESSLHVIWSSDLQQQKQAN